MSSSAPNYIRWDAKGVEVEQENEKQRIQDVAGQFCRFQRLNENEHGHCYRGTHLKTQGVVIGKFNIHKDLPEHLAQGLFKQSGEHDCILRYSSLTPKYLPDTAPAPRGIGLLVLDAKGERMWEGAPAPTQAFLFNNYPVLELRDPQTTYEIADSLERNWNQLDKFAAEQVARKDADVACRGAALPQQDMVAMPQYSQSAFRHGDFVAKYGVFPKGEEQIKLKDWRVKPDDPINILSTRLQDFHRKHEVTYSFCAQMLVNLDEQPVDDIGIEWPEGKFPFEELATITIPKQDSNNDVIRNWANDKITMNTWHCLKEHQPLGSTNRMRRVVYAESRKLRGKINGVEKITEPATLADLPVSLKEIAV